MGKIGDDLRQEQDQELHASPARKEQRMKNSTNYFNLEMKFVDLKLRKIVIQT